MDLTLERDAGLAAMTKLSGVAAKKTTIPVLTHVLVTAEADGRVTLRASDSEMQAVAQAAASVAQAGQATVPAAKLADILKLSPEGGQLRLAMDGARVSAKCGRSRYLLPTLPYGDFPKYPVRTPTHEMRISAKALARAIDRTAFAICADQTRYYLAGIRLDRVAEGEAQRLRFVATDGTRLAYAQTDCPEGWAAAPGLTIPAKLSTEVRRLIDGLGGDVDLWTDGKLFGCRTETAEVVGPLNAGAYPDYTRVIPKTEDVRGRLKADVTELSAALRRCGVAIAGDTRPVRVTISAGTMRLMARDGDGGEAEELVDVEYDGEDAQLSFNARFLGEAVGQMSGEWADIAFGSIADPVKILDPKDDQVLQVLMPLRV